MPETPYQLFFAACARGDVESLRGLLSDDPGLVRTTDGTRPYPGWTGLHAAAERGHTEAVRLLLSRGADPNAREAGDNAYPLHFAAGCGHLETVRVLLDAGGDVHGFGDVHQGDVIGWATLGDLEGRQELLALLLGRGARHHIFSAIATGDLALIREVVRQDPKALDRRMSRFEQGQSPLHFAMSRKRCDILDLLIELGADREATNGNGRTALEVAILFGDREAMTRLHAAGARLPQPSSADSQDWRAGVSASAESIKKGIPMISVPDIAATLDWYTSIGFKELGRHSDGGLVNWGMLSFGKAELMLSLGAKPGRARDVSLWFYTDQIERLYHLLRDRQIAAGQAALAGQPGPAEGIEFTEDIYNPFYGGRQFGIRDPNGYNLYFLQPD
jgi:hypothetical protein